jgi:hypothetical protein
MLLVPVVSSRRKKQAKREESMRQYSIPRKERKGKRKSRKMNRGR